MGTKCFPGSLSLKVQEGMPLESARKVYVRGLFSRRKQYHLLFKERIPAGNKARLPGEPQHGHQDEKKSSHHFRVAIKSNRPAPGTGKFLLAFSLSCQKMLAMFTREMQVGREREHNITHFIKKLKYSLQGECSEMGPSNSAGGSRNCYNFLEAILMIYLRSLKFGPFI